VLQHGTQAFGKQFSPKPAIRVSGSNEYLIQTKKKQGDNWRGNNTLPNDRENDLSTTLGMGLATIRNAH